MLKYTFLIAVLLIAIPVRANTSFYVGASAEATFNIAIATAGLTEINSPLDFSGYSGNQGPTLTNANGTGIDFLDTTNSNNLTVTSGTLQTAMNGDHVSVNFPGTDVLAFGFHFTVPSGFAFWCLDPSGGSVCQYQITVTSSTDTEFFGMVSTTPLTGTLAIFPESGANILEITNFEAFDSAVPEPATLGLMGFGLIMLAAIRRRVRCGLNDVHHRKSHQPGTSPTAG